MGKAFEVIFWIWLLGVLECWWTGTYDVPHRLVWPVSAIMDVTTTRCPARGEAVHQ